MTQPTRPTREQAFEAFLILMAYVTGQRAEPVVYDQRNLPPDTKSADAFKRRHRELRKAGIEGAWVRGKMLCCTAEAWATVLPRQRAPVPSTGPMRDIDAEISAALGIRVLSESEMRQRAKAGIGPRKRSR